MGFTFTETVECEYCGSVLEESAEKCPECGMDERVPFVFREFMTDETREVIAAESATPRFAYEKFAKSLDGDDPWRYFFLGQRRTVDNLLRTNDIGDIKPQMMPIDYPNPEDLREMASYTNT